MTSSRTSPHRALLLLPPAPEAPSYTALKAAYYPSLFSVLRKLAGPPHGPQEPALLQIALPCPHLYGHLNAPRASLYAVTQQLVADLYKLICIITSREAIDTEGANGLDARIVLLAYPRDHQLNSHQSHTPSEQDLQGPAVDMHAFAQSAATWDAIYSVECDAGEAVLQSFLSSSKPTNHVSRVQGGSVQVEKSASDTASPEAAMNSKNHLSVAVGGTFDHLHIGHKLLLTMFAFVLGRRQTADSKHPSTLTIGITGDALLKNKKYAEHLESWKHRQESVHDFLSSLVYFGRSDDPAGQRQEINNPGPNGHAVHVSYPFGLTIKYVEIWDPFGPTITDEEITALVLSLETRGGGAAVNTKRKEQGWSELDVFEVSVLDASEEDSVDETFQSKLSSTEIRRKRSERIQSRAKA